MSKPRRPLFASTAIACWMAAMALTANVGCAIAPTEGQTVTTNYPFHVQGYAEDFELVTVEMYDQCSGTWVDQDTTLSSFDASFPAGYWNSSPELHYYEIWMMMPGVCYFRTDNCPSPHACGYMRLRQDAIDGSGNTRYLYGGEETSLGCTLAQLGQGVDFYTASLNCGYDNTVITLHTDTL